MTSQQPALTFYTTPGSPICQRVEIALLEAKAVFTTKEIDIDNKPTWFVELVNPMTGKVPVLAVGGPKGVPPEASSPDAVKIPESLVILELIADLFPESGLMPKDPVKRAHIRLLIDRMNTDLRDTFKQVLTRQKGIDALLDVVLGTQALLPKQGFACGEEFTIVDIFVITFLGRLFGYIVDDRGLTGAFLVKYGKGVAEALQTEEKYERIRRYVEDALARESCQAVCLRHASRPGV